jgi:hypothetical protein
MPRLQPITKEHLASKIWIIKPSIISGFYEKDVQQVIFKLRQETWKDIKSNGGIKYWYCICPGSKWEAGTIDLKK